MFRRLTSYLLAMLLATIGPTAVGQENTAIDPFGMDFVQLLFEQAGTRPVDIRAAISAPRQSVLVLTGRVPPPYQGFVRMFVVQGGTLLYASDRGSSRSNSWFHLASGPVTVTDPALMYQDYSDCFRVKVARHELTRGVREIVVNRSGVLTFLSGRGWTPVARLPVAGSPYLVAAFEAKGHRAVVMADHSLLTNDMLLHADNAILAVNIVNWLTSGGQNQVAFIHDGHQLTAGSGLPPMLPPDSIPPIDPDDIPQDTKIALANRFLSEVQKTNALNRFLASIRPSRYWRWLILIPTLLLAAKIVFRLLRGDRGLVQPPAILAMTAAEGRAQDMVRSGSLQNVAVDLARDLLERLTGSRDPAAWQPENWVLVTEGPATLVRRNLQGDLTQLALVAATHPPRPLKHRALKRLARRMNRISRWHANGRLRLQSKPATT